MDKISIIIPVYNSEKTIKRCFDSIVCQTYRNYEVIAVDDCSTDESEEIIAGYVLADNRFKLYKVPHGGVSAARNYGLRMADGDYIQFIDSDDDIEPNMLEIMLNMLKAENADIAVCNYTHPCIKNYLGDVTLDFTDIRNHILYYQNTFATHIPWNKLYRREIITDCFDEDCDFCEDGLFGLANMANAKKIVSTSKQLYHYFVAPPETKFEEMSCINKIAKANDFWLTKQTYWYKLMGLKHKLKATVEKHYEPRYFCDIYYIRLFDFMLWELIILSSLNVDKNGLKCEMQNIFAEPEFIKSIEAKAKYGIKLKQMSIRERNVKVAEFVDQYQKFQEYGLNTGPFYIAIDLFCDMFIERNDMPLDTLDFLAMAYSKLESGNNAEAQLINEFCHTGLKRKIG